MPEPLGRNTLADLVYLPRTVAVRDDTGVRHTDTKRVLDAFDIPRVDAGCGDANTNFSDCRMRVRHLSYGQYLFSWSLFFVPRCLHLTAARRTPLKRIRTYAGYRSPGEWYGRTGYRFTRSPAARCLRDPPQLGSSHRKLVPDISGLR